jgi:hypothetical protein
LWHKNTSKSRDPAADLTVPILLNFDLQPHRKVNTHTFGWMVLAFLVSFLWFKIGNQPRFPLGFVGSLVIIYWSTNIDKALGKKSIGLTSVTMAFIGMLGMLLGYLIR